MREERGIRQEDIAIRIGYPQSYVSKYETGQRSLDIIEVSGVCEALGVSLLEFARRLEARLTP